MKYKIELKKFLTVLERNEKIITKNITFPILSYVLLVAEKNSLVVYSTDFEINFRSVIKDVEIEKEGKVCVAGKELLGFLKGVNEKNITVELEGMMLTLKGKKFEIKLKTINTDDYPVFPEISGEIELEVTIRAFKKALRETYQSATIIETRPEISGFLIKGENTDVKVVATDSFRLSETTIFNANSAKKDFEVILSYKVGRQLFNLLTDEDKKLTLLVGKNQISFSFSGSMLAARLIEGKFPDYKKIIPSQFNTRVVINREELLSSLKRVSIFSTKINDVRLKITPPGDITLISKNPDLGESVYSLESKIDGKELETAFNYKYLIEGLNQIEGEKVVLSFVSREKPLLIQLLEDASYLYLVMPIREV